MKKLLSILCAPLILVCQDELPSCQTTSCRTFCYIFNLEVPKVPFDHEDGIITIFDHRNMLASCKNITHSPSFNIVGSVNELVSKKFYFLDSIVPASAPASDALEYRLVYFSNSLTNEQLELIIDTGGGDIEGVGVNYLNAKGEYIKKE